MTATPGGIHGSGALSRTQRTVITNAQSAASAGQATRQRRYAITMAFRTACFVSMIFVPGTLRWVLFGCAVFLPYVAVLFANQADTRTETSDFEHGEPSSALQITDGRQPTEVIEGSIVEETERRSA